MGWVGEVKGQGTRDKGYMERGKEGINGRGMGQGTRGTNMYGMYVWVGEGKVWEGHGAIKGQASKGQGVHGMGRGRCGRDKGQGARD